MAKERHSIPSHSESTLSVKECAEIERIEYNWGVYIKMFCFNKIQNNITLGCVDLLPQMLHDENYATHTKDVP